VLRQNVANLQSKLETMSPTKPTTGPLDMAGTVKALSEARDQFRADPTWATMRAAKQPCDVMLTSVVGAKLPVDITPNFNCEPPSAETRQLLTLREKVLEGRENFNRFCALESKDGNRGALGQAAQKGTPSSQRAGRGRKVSGQLHHGGKASRPLGAAGAGISTEERAIQA
jgi:hypothetical protein